MSDDFSAFFGPDGFDVNSVPPPDNFGVLPPNKYVVTLDKVEVKQTKAGTGHYVSVAMSVLDGEQKGRKLWDNINFDNPNKTAVDIGLKALGALGRAAGIARIRRNELDRFLGKVVVADVKVRGDQNVIANYLPTGQEQGSQPAQTNYSASPQATAPQQSQAPASAPDASAKVAPWKR